MSCVRRSSWCLGSCLLLLFVGCGSKPPTTPNVTTSGPSAARPSSSRPREEYPRNVILLLSDGTAPEAWTLARWVKGNALTVDDLLTGAVRTYGADSLITDSAPGATAYATGFKTTDKTIAVGAFRTTVEGVKSPPELAQRPLVTLVEAAQRSGYATGLVATSQIQHATPAAFSAHVLDRNLYEDIAEQQVHQNIDIVLGGGEQYLLPKSVAPGIRADGENLVDALRSRGYAVVTTRDELLSAASGKVWGAFAVNELASECDRPRFAPKQPSLAEMTEQAISRLSRLPPSKTRGFFLFVEGSKVDWAAHGNDPVGVVSELLAFDAAVFEALKFAKQHANTQVIVVSDHGTGGLTIGSRTDPNYSQTTPTLVVEPLRKAKISGERLTQMLLTSTTPEAITTTLNQEWAITDLSKEDLDELVQKKQSEQTLAPVLSRIISTRARIGWTTTGHTGADEYLFAYGPDHPRGLVENTAIGEGIARYLGLDLSRLQTELFIDLKKALTESGYACQLDRTDPNNLKLKVSKGQRTAELFQSKNWLVANGKRYELPGVVVFTAEQDQVFGPKEILTVLGRELP